MPWAYFYLLFPPQIKKLEKKYKDKIGDLKSNFYLARILCVLYPGSEGSSSSDI